MSSFVLTITKVSEPPRKRLRLTAGLEPVSNSVLTRIPGIKERRSIRIATQVQLKDRARSAFFRILPPEIRIMVYKIHFESLGCQKDARIEPGMIYAVHDGEEVELLALEGDNYKACPVLDIFLVCKEMYHEAKPILWSEMHFRVRSLILLDKLCSGKQLAHNRLPRHIPMMYPVHLIRNLELRLCDGPMGGPEMLESLWYLCERTSDNFKFKISYDDSHEPAEEWASEAAAILTVFHDMKAYQARRIEARQGLRVGKREMYSWIDEDSDAFIVIFPGSSDEISHNDQSQA